MCAIFAVPGGFLEHGLGVLRFSFRAFTSGHLRCQHVRILRPAIARRSQDPGFAKPDGTKLIKEGAALLGTRDSGKPIALFIPNLRREGGSQNEFRNVDGTVRPDDSSQLPKD